MPAARLLRRTSPWPRRTRATGSRVREQLAVNDTAEFKLESRRQAEMWLGGNRTPDTRIFSPLLCQLSYPADRWPPLRTFRVGCVNYGKIAAAPVKRFDYRRWTQSDIV